MSWIRINHRMMQDTSIFIHAHLRKQAMCSFSFHVGSQDMYLSRCWLQHLSDIKPSGITTNYYSTTHVVSLDPCAQCILP